MLTQSTQGRAVGFMLLGLVIFACRSNASNDLTPSVNDAGSTVEGGTRTSEAGGLDGALVNDASFVEGPDVPPVAFPTTVPPVFGYALVDAFPGTFLSGAMDMQWPAGSSEPFVLQRGGDIVRLHADGTRDECLSFEQEVAVEAEAGALGMALHPKFADPVAPQPYVYVWYNDPVTATTTHQHLSRFTWSATTNVFDPASELVLVDQAETTPEHNGARLRFGTDGFLYFGNGDDTIPATTAQTLVGGLFSGVFRIDVDSIGGAVSHVPPRQPLNAATQGYFIPNDNPFVGQAGVDEEYYALGFRNPYSFTVDRTGGAIWLGDVGDTWREEIDHVIPAGNYGWPIFEGDLTRQPGVGISIGLVLPPVYTYSHASIADLSSIDVGFVYRGTALPELGGKLIYSDWPTGRVWALDTAAGTRASLVESNWQASPVGFGQDETGEIYVISWSQILKLVRAPAPSTVPLALSDTHIFRNLGTLETPSALHPYSVRSPLWSDAAAKQRWIYVPPGQTAAMAATGTVTLPIGSMLIKQFDLPDAAQPTNGRTRHLETRVLVTGSDTSYGVTYRWRADGSDADLVTNSIDESIDDAVPAESRTWHFPSTGECWSCHRAENRVLAFRGEQLNFALPDGINQLSFLANAGVFDNVSISTAPAPIVSPSDTTASTDDRATAYIAANCAPCHHPGASYLGSGQTWNAEPGVAIADRGLVNAPNNNPPVATAFGLPDVTLVDPGDPSESLMWLRMNSVDPDLRMPPVGRTQVDPIGVMDVSAWISAM